MKVNYSVVLEPTDVEEAINAFLLANGVDATVTADDIIEGLTDDLSILINTTGAAPTPTPAPKRRRRTAKVVAEEEAKTAESALTPKTVVDGDGSERKQTILEEANEANEKRVAKTEKVKAVTIDDDDEDEDNDLNEGNAEEEEEVVETPPKKEAPAEKSTGTVPLSKQGIFKKRVKK